MHIAERWEQWLWLKGLTTCGNHVESSDFQRALIFPLWLEKSTQHKGGKGKFKVKMRYFQMKFLLYFFYNLTDYWFPLLERLNTSYSPSLQVALAEKLWKFNIWAKVNLNKPFKITIQSRLLCHRVLLSFPHACSQNALGSSTRTRKHSSVSLSVFLISWELSPNSARQYYDWNLKSYFEACKIYLFL